MIFLDFEAFPMDFQGTYVFRLGTIDRPACTHFAQSAETLVFIRFRDFGGNCPMAITQSGTLAASPNDLKPFAFRRGSPQK